ncbi:MAG TPA: hypothetical protein VE291_03020 [Terracidiphilus sp.]|jgi:hypothetical protein|nr:hypothetical protein [Terracidiphilus sp.]
MIQIQLQPEVEARLAAEAAARGMKLETYVRTLVEEQVSDQQTGKEQSRRAVEAMLGFAGEYGVTLGGEGLKSMVHEGHKY